MTTGWNVRGSVSGFLLFRGEILGNEKDGGCGSNGDGWGEKGGAGRERDILDRNEVGEESTCWNRKFEEGVGDVAGGIILKDSELGLYRRA